MSSTSRVCQHCKIAFDCDICKLFKIESCLDCYENCKKNLQLMLCAREVPEGPCYAVPHSPFYKDNLPLDLFKIIYRYVDVINGDLRWQMPYRVKDTLFHPHYCRICYSKINIVEYYPFCAACYRLETY